ncbi:hypothetical protein [Nocardia alni]|uniref:ATP dependent DNA ligase n=1 Tax=Nocardia alni TaxID=2815723 RepID=UPI0034D70018
MPRGRREPGRRPARLRVGRLWRWGCGARRKPLSGDGADALLRAVAVALTEPATHDSSLTEIIRSVTECAQGLVLKRLASTYQPGRRARAWLKVPLRKVESFAVVGWLEGSSTNRDSFGSLVLAGRLDGQLRYVGAVGSGFTMTGRRAIRDALDRLARPDPALDVEPPREIARASRGSGAMWLSPISNGLRRTVSWSVPQRA